MAVPLCNSIGVCTFRIARGGPVYLLLRRAPGERLYPGIWQFVTGMVRAGESAIEAARRELREETGLMPARFWVVPFVDCYYDASADSVNLSPLFAAEVGEIDQPVLSVEHSDFNWFSLEDAAAKLAWPGQRSGLRIVHDYIIGGEEASRLTEIR